jgi:predicted transcriptional regulator
LPMAREVLAVRVEPELRAALDAAAAARGMSRSALVRQSLLSVVDLDELALGLRRRTVSEIRAGWRREMMARRDLAARGAFGFSLRESHSARHGAQGYQR